MAYAILTMHALEIPFKHVIAHTTAIRSKTESVLITAESVCGQIGIGEGCPRSYVTGETVETTTDFFQTNRVAIEDINNLDDLRKWMRANRENLDENPAIWCAIELALLDCMAKEQGQSIEAFLGLPELWGEFKYSAVLSAENMKGFQKQIDQYAVLGFWDFKVKVTGNIEEDKAKIALLKSLDIQNLRIRLDANNLWKKAEDAVNYVRCLQYPFMAIEEPLQVGDYDGCRLISQALDVPIILDESFLRIDQFNHLQTDPQGWIINVRISKMGGVLRSLEIAERAKEMGIPIILGAQVGETSILSRAALVVANQYRDILLAQEGAFGTYLLEHDVISNPIMFGRCGIIDAPSLSGKVGHGLICS